jgi:hypothetical protein
MRELVRRQDARPADVRDTRAVQRLRETYSWPELARWSTTRATDELRAVLDHFSDQGATRDG